MNLTKTKTFLILAVDRQQCSMKTTTFIRRKVIVSPEGKSSPTSSQYSCSSSLVTESVAPLRAWTYSLTFLDSVMQSITMTFQLGRDAKHSYI